MKRATPVAVLAVCLAWTAAADAKTFEVTRPGDPAPGNCKPRDCSLREAVMAASARPGKDEIVLPLRRYRLTQANPGGTEEDTGAFGDLDLSGSPLSIAHPGRGVAKIANGVDGDRVIEVLTGARTTLKKLVVTGGETTGDGGGIQNDAALRLVRSAVSGNIGDDGGGIDPTSNDAATVLIRSKVRGNHALDDGGAINGSSGPIVVKRSRITGNQADDTAGGIRSTGAVRLVVRRSTIAGNETAADGGGILAEAGSITLDRSTIADNEAAANGGGVALDTGAVATIRASTLSGNTAAAGNGGGLSVGMFDAASANVVNSTFAGNRAGNRGGGIDASTGSDVTLNATSVVRNVADADDALLIEPLGGGIAKDGALTTFTAGNSLIVLNTFGQMAEDRNDCANNGPPFTSLGGNLISTLLPEDQCEGFETDKIRSNPKIGKLRTNGGPTKTVALKKGSPAIGEARKPSAPNRDQRGRKRDNNPDAGAFERGA